MLMFILMASASRGSEVPLSHHRMGVLWRTASPPASTSGSELAAGAVPCVVGNRVFLVGGYTAKADPDIALGLSRWSSSLKTHQDDVAGNERKLPTNTAPPEACLQGDALKAAAVAARSTTDGEVLAANVSGSQEGDIPAARIGHAAVVGSAQRTIILFAGQTPGDAFNGHCQKLADVHEGTLKDPSSATLVWRILSHPRSSAIADSLANDSTPNGVDSPENAPPPMAFHASCAASVQGNWAMLVHGGMDEKSELLGDLWALRLQSEITDGGRKNGGDNDGSRRPGFSWERLNPEGAGPPPIAYHTATSINDGKVVIFIGGGRRQISSTFLLDTGGLRWSSIEVAGLPERCLHTAIPVVYEPDSTDEGQDVDSESLRGESAAAAVPGQCLWEPIASVGRSSSPQITSGGAAVRDGIAPGQGNDGEGIQARRPVFESILVFGGIGGSAVSEDATILRVDGTAVPLALDRHSSGSPGRRYNHAMVSVDHGRQIFLFGGCCGNGSRLQETFVLNLADDAAGRDSGIVDAGLQGTDLVDGGELQGDVTVTLPNGDVFTGHLNAEGYRHGQGRCEFASIEGDACRPKVDRPSGGSYSGDWEADQPHGQGERIYSQRDGFGGGKRTDADTAKTVGAFGPRCPPIATYNGEWKRGIRDGKGTCTFAVPSSWSSGSVDHAFPTSSRKRQRPRRRDTDNEGGGGGGSGEGHDGSAHGEQGLSSPLPVVPHSYEGEWKDDRPFGRGTLHFRGLHSPVEGGGGSRGCQSGHDGGDRRHEGDIVGFVNGGWSEEGMTHGRENLPGNEGVFEGQYRMGKREGHGRLELPNGSEYEGAWRNGRPNGIGTFCCGVTRQVYAGKWVGGVRCGRGVCKYASGARYDGIWQDGMRHGRGTLTSSPGGCSREGMWNYDEFQVPSVVHNDGGDLLQDA